MILTLLNLLSSDRSDPKSGLTGMGESGFFKWDWELIMLLKTDSV
jgi:hypothetical protein